MVRDLMDKSVCAHIRSAQTFCPLSETEKRNGKKKKAKKKV